MWSALIGRHTVASRLVMAGVDLLTVMQLGGWKSLAMVQRYGHLSLGHRKNAVERLVTGSAPARTAVATVRSSTVISTSNGHGTRAVRETLETTGAGGGS
jgi:site-specific recombinase XerD